MLLKHVLPQCSRTLMITKILHMLPPYSTHFIGKYPHRYIAINLQSPCNQALKERLTRDGFFRYYTTNKGFLITEHQVIGFYKRGGQERLAQGLTAPGDEWEWHHINGCGTLNRPENLVLVPVWFHNILTKKQKAVNRYLKLFRKKAIELPQECELYDWHGRRVVNQLNWCVKVIALTCVRSYLYALQKGICDPSIKLAPLADFKNWLKKIRRYLELGIDTTYVKLLWLKQTD